MIPIPRRAASAFLSVVLACGDVLTAVPVWAEGRVSVEEAEARLKAHLDYIKGRLRELTPRYSGNVPPDEPEPQDDGNNYQARYAAFLEPYRAQLRKTIQDAMAKHGVPSVPKLAFDISSTYSAVNYMWGAFNFGKLDEPDSRPADGCYPGFYTYHTCALEVSLHNLGVSDHPPSADALEGVDKGMETWKQLDREAEQLMDRLVDGYIRLIKIQVQRDKVTEDFERDAKAFDPLLSKGAEVEWRKQMEPLWERMDKARAQLDAEAEAVDKELKGIGERIQQLANTKLFASIRGEGLLEEEQPLVVDEDEGPPEPAEEEEREFEVTFFDEEPPKPVIVDIIVLDDAPTLKGKPIPWLPGFGDEQVRKARWLFVYGWDLPTDPEILVLFADDPKVHYEILEYASPYRRYRWSDAEGRSKAWELGWELALEGVPKERAKTMKLMSAMLVEVYLRTGMAPGFRDFRLNEANSQWLLRYGNTRASLQFARTIAEGQTEPTTNLFLPEEVFLEVRAENEVELDALDLVLGHNGKVLGTREKPLVVSATKVPGSPTTYRTAPIVLLEEGRPKPPMAAGAVPVVVKPNDVLQASPLQKQLFILRPQTAIAQIRLNPGEVKSLWREALFRAVKARQGESWFDEYWNKVFKIQSLSEEEVYKVSNLIITEARIRTVRIKIGQLAAMILLRDALLQMLEAHQKELPAITTDRQFWSLRTLIEPHITNPRFPLREVPVTVPGPGLLRDPSTFLIKGITFWGTVPFWQSFDEEFLNEWNWRSDGQLQWQLKAMKEAFAKYKAAVAYALEKAKKTDERDIKALLELTSAGMEPVVSLVLPNLLTLDESQKPRLRWVPDQAARREVLGIPTLAAELQAQGELSEADTQVALAAGSLLPFLAPAGSLGRWILSVSIGAAGLADTAITQVPDYFHKQEELQFAQGIAGIVGPDRANVAQMKQTSAWGTVLAVVTCGIGIGGDIFEAIELASKSRALARSAQLVKAVEQGGVEAYLVMPKADKTALTIAMGEAELAQQAGQLTATQRRLMEAATELSSELKNLRRAITETDALEPLSPRAAQEAADGADSLGPPPKEFSVVRTAAGRAFQLGKRLGGDSAFARVYDLADDPKHVVKFMTPKTARRVQQCAKLLEDAGIPQLKNVEYHIGDDVAVVIQEKGVRGTEFKMFNRTDSTDPTKFLRRYQRATVKLYRKMADAGIVWEDGHVENLYFVKRNGEWVAGILDQDHLGRWENLPHELATTRIDDIEIRPGLHNVHSMQSILRSAQRAPHTRFSPTPQFFMEKMLEHKRWIEYGKAGFGRVRIEVEIVREYFPDFERHVVTDWDAFLGAGR